MSGVPGPGWRAACALAATLIWLRLLLLHMEPTRATMNSEGKTGIREPKSPTSSMSLPHPALNRSQEDLYLVGSSCRVPGFLGAWEVGSGRAEVQRPGHPLFPVVLSCWMDLRLLIQGPRSCTAHPCKPHIIISRMGSAWLGVKESQTSFDSMSQALCAALPLPH